MIAPEARQHRQPAPRWRARSAARPTLPYNASKAAVVSMTKSLALAHAADGIRVNCVCPGFVETRHVEHGGAASRASCSACRPRSSRASARRRCRWGAMERTEDVANVIGFLASSESGYMTGQALSVDGGLVMH